ncbi:MAG: CDP-diacylglycerol--glycerol-3-phosphate 3-phosphatidyltransferase [Actinomycetales bacterium]|nr:CDP-diacylglycerol--glycerol-3-phosphate 3-phosphatidyltransferase [Actinomycetales bacterium]
MRPAIPDRAGDPVSDAPVLNLPNALTALRVACVPLLVVLLWMDDGTLGPARDAAAIVFVLASITDFVDGAIARRYGLVTTFGKVADPIADKALTGVALIGLSALGELPWWVTVLILIREVGVTMLRFWVIEHGVIPASRGGKAKTLAQTVAITMYLADIPLDWWPEARAVAMGVAVVLTVVTGIDYVVRAVRLRQVARGAAATGLTGG